MARRDPFRFIGAVTLAILICVLALAGASSTTQWTAQGSSGNVAYVTMTGAYTSYQTSVNQYGQTTTMAIVTTGTYVGTTTQAAQAATSSVITTVITTTQSAQTTTQTTNLLQAWLGIIFTGTYELLDPSGNPVESGGIYTLVKAGKTVQSMDLDATYTIQGEGIDWNSLKVDIYAVGSAYQPSASDANVPTVVNENNNLQQAKCASSCPRSGHVKVTAPITDALVGNKAWDHSRTLTTAMGLAAHVSANVASGYTYMLNGVPSNTVTFDLSPVIGVTSLSWEEPITPITPTQPSQPSQPTYTPTPTCGGTVCPQTPTPTYTDTVARDTGRLADRVTGGDRESRGDVARTGALKERALERGFELLSSPLISVYGADLVYTLNPWIIVLGFTCAIITLLLLRSRKKKRRI